MSDRHLRLSFLEGLFRRRAAACRPAPRRRRRTAGVERLEQRLALAAMPQLVENFNFGAGSGQPIAETFTAVGSTTFFAAWHADAGVELWKTDGTTEGTVLVKDVWPGPASSILPGRWIAAPAAGRVYFRAQVIEGGSAFENIWSSDGTQGGTTRITNFPAGGPNLATLALVGSKVYFTDFTSLYTIDTGTQQVQIVKQFASGVLARGIAFGGKLYFAASDGQGYELYASDGSLNGTAIVRDINPAANGSSFPDDFTVVGNRLLFTAENGDSGRELWVSDGLLGGTTQVDDINPLAASSTPSHLAALGGKLYFSAENSQKRDLYVYDPTTPTVRPIRIDVNPGTVVASNPAEFTLFGGTVYFVATSAASGRELYRLSGSTPTLIDIAPGQPSSNPAGLRVAGQSLVFRAENASGDRELYRVGGDGTASLLANIWDGGSSSPETLATVGGTVFFSADDGRRGRELWKTDGTAAGTLLVRDLYDGHPFDFRRRHGEPAEFVEFDGRLFFTANSFNREGNVGPLDDRRLYSVGANGRHALGQERPRAWSIVPPRDLSGTGVAHVSGLTLVGSTLYFSLSYFDLDGALTPGGWLYKLDAGSSAAVEVKRFATAAPILLQAFKGRLFFSASVAGDRQLWVSSGTGDSTVEFGNAYDPSYLTAFTPSVPSIHGSYMFFQAREPGTTNYEVWRTDGINGGVTGRFADLNTDRGSFPSQFTSFQGRLYFTATGKDGNGDYGTELYSTDGFQSPTLVRDINDRPGAGSFPSSLTGFKGHLYFSAFSQDHGREVWRTTGTGAERMTDLQPGPADSLDFNAELTVAGDRLYVPATDGRWAELWSTTDGVGFVRATAINANGPASPSLLTAVGPRLYFLASDGVHGQEPWQLDTATNTARLVADINFGSGRSGVSIRPAVFDSKLYFAADDGVAGAELWALSLTVPSPATPPTAPSSVSGVPGSGQVSLSWTAPTSTGGAAITNYLVQFSSNSGGSWANFNRAASTATTATVSGLTNGTAYVFRVAAVNSVGTGTFSPPSASIQPVAGSGTGTTIESAGSVTLARDSAGFLRANGTPVRFGGNPVLAANATWGFLAAETIAGVNMMVLRHSTGFLHVWRLDASWNFVSGEGRHTPGSGGYGETELVFGMDFNGDGMAGENVGQTRLTAGGDGFLRAGTATVRLDGRPVPARNQNWRFVAAETISGVNLLVLRHASGFLHIWRLDAGWNVVGGDGRHVPGSSGFSETEIIFGMDFNGDGLAGEAVGRTTLTVGADGFLRANATLIRSGGRPVAAVNPNWRFLAAETISGVNTVVLRHSSGYLLLWRMDAAWNLTRAEGWHAPPATVPGGPASPGHDFTEVTFGMDFNNDGVVGEHSLLEAVGNATLGRDSGGLLRANGFLVQQAGRPIPVVNSNWAYLAAETIAGVNSLALRHSSGFLLIWRLDAAWNVVRSDGWHAPGSAGFRGSEVVFGMDFDRDGRIGA